MLSQVPTGYAYWIWSPESGKFVSSESATQDQANELFQFATNFQNEKQYDRAIEEYQNLIRKYPTSEMAGEAQYQVGLIYEEQEEYSKAFEAYKKLTDNYPQTKHLEDVAERLFKIANLYLAGRKEKVMGVSVKSGNAKAVDILQHIVKMAPYSKYGDQAQFHIGLAYKQMRQYTNAIQAFQKLIDDYPNSTLLDDARYQLADTSYEYSKRSARDERVMDEAIENVSAFLERYPESNMTEKVAQLRKDINERDAEKNYEIAIFYEKENELESAALYYGDVVKRHPETEHGKKAAQKLEVLKEPLKGVRAKKEALQIQSESIQQRIDALKEESAKSGKSKEEIADEKKKLEAESESLVSQQNRFKKEEWSRFKEREAALKASEKTWREKKKNLDAKRKEMKANRAPELERAFRRWEASLAEEKEMLGKERQLISELKGELISATDEKPSKGWRFPFMGKRKSIENLVRFKLKELEEIRSKRERISKKHSELESQIATFISLDHEKNQVEIDDTDLNEKRQEIDGLIQKLKEKRETYQEQFGDMDPERWSIEASMKNLQEIEEAKLSEEQIKNELEKLQREKLRISHAWFDQKKTVETISNAFEYGSVEETEKQKELEKTKGAPPAVSSEDIANSTLEERSLKKRIKFLEREIRSRLDEISDWNEKKDIALAKLDAMMNEGKKNFVTEKIVKPVTAPFRFMFWLGRSLAFGLNQDERRVMKQANRKVARGVNEERYVEIRKLQEEIELESLLIQGRYQEVQMFENELKNLKQVATEKGIEIRPIYLERDFEVGKESLRSAERIIEDQSRYESLIGKLDQETRKLEAIQNELDTIDLEISSLHKKSSELKVFQAESKVKKEETGEEEVQEGEGPKKKMEAELDRLKSEIEAKEEEYREEKEALKPKVSSEKPLEINPKIEKLNQEMKDLKNKEKKLILDEQEILNEKKELIQKELDRFKNKTDNPRYQLLYSELEETDIQIAGLKTASA